MSQSSWHWKANITDESESSQRSIIASQSSWHWKANITLNSLPRLSGVRESQSSWHWKANITILPKMPPKLMFLSQSSWHWKANITARHSKNGNVVLVAILMTLEGEYYTFIFNPWWGGDKVAILMTLEGEYYRSLSVLVLTENCRNPHDIGRRILLATTSFPIGSLTSQSSWHWKANITDRSSLKSEVFTQSQSSWHWKANITLGLVKPYTESAVAILMTLEGEYYQFLRHQQNWKRVAILMTLEGEYYTH